MEKHDRYFYQRKVPLELQPIIGRKKWRAPLGPDVGQALDKLKEFKVEHDELISKLEDPETRQNLKTQTRRSAEQEFAEKVVEQERAYESWCRATGIKTDGEEFVEAFPDLARNPWKEARDHVAGVEAERSRHLPPDNRYDTVGVAPLIRGVELGAMLADKAFDSNWIVGDMNARAAKIVISQRPERLRPIAIDDEMEKWRHLIENYFQKLKEFKRIAMRSDKTETSYAAMINLWSAIINSK